MKLSLYISPCPNDTLSFEAMISGRVDCNGLEFDTHFLDIDQLNAVALSGKADIIKVSYGVVPKLWKEYYILDSGSALGRGNGPLLVAGEDSLPLNPRVAIPGEDTTANLLLTRLMPQIEDKPVYLFSDIAHRVLCGDCHAGVLIHEGRFTYQSLGLKLVADLGQLWEEQMSLPLPLGGILVNRRLPLATQLSIQNILRNSVLYGLSNRAESHLFVRSKARELSANVIDSHIDMFVNQYSVSLTEEGHRAIRSITSLENEDIFLPLC